jgi:hypothetical protein
MFEGMSFNLECLYVLRSCLGLLFFEIKAGMRTLHTSFCPGFTPTDVLFASFLELFDVLVFVSSLGPLKILFCAFQSTQYARYIHLLLQNPLYIPLWPSRTK